MHSITVGTRCRSADNIEGYCYSATVSIENPSQVTSGNLSNATIKKAYKYYYRSSTEGILFE
ncbi:MAG: hypothetical protein ACI36V_02980 [Coriobacteriales bacterium]